jgi:16S rRNA processing protein RimM
MGVIGRAHGVRGHVRVTSYTADPAALTEYGPLTDRSGRRLNLRWVADGIAEVSEQTGDRVIKIADRAAAERLTNTQLFVDRDRLPAPDAEEYYLTDLIGLSAFAPDDTALGLVSGVHDYGAGASLEVSGQDGSSFLVPFTAACVPQVDVQRGRVVVMPPDEIEGAETLATAREGISDAGSSFPSEPDISVSRLFGAEGVA